MAATEIEKIVDICATKHGGNEQSRAANRKNRNSREAQRMRVFELIKDSYNGLSMKEVAEIMDVQLNTISGRGSSLKQLGLVEPTGEVRNGSAVLQATSKVFAPVVEPTAPEPEPLREPVKPMSPAQVNRELDKLDSIYEHHTLTDEQYDKAKTRIMAAFEAWFNEVDYEQ
jgi:hypothetical protein